MSVVFFLVPLGLLLIGLAVWAFVWAVNNDQFDDLDRAAHSILYDDDERPANEPTSERTGRDAP